MFSAQVIELTKLPSGYFYVELDCTASGAERYTDGLPFLVDTASSRSFIVPWWRNEFKRVGISLSRSSYRSDTLVGSVKYRDASDIDLMFASADFQSTVTVSLSKLAFVEPAQPFQGRIGAPASQEGVPYNVLGLDVLSNFSLLAEEGKQGKAYLIHGFPLIANNVAEIEGLHGRFAPATIPNVTVVPPGEDPLTRTETSSTRRHLDISPVMASRPPWFGKLHGHAQIASTKKKRMELRHEPRRAAEFALVATPSSHDVRIRDLTSMGVNLLSNRDYSVGESITLLPRGEEKRDTLTVHVVHRAKKVSGFEIGCTIE